MSANLLIALPVLGLCVVLAGLLMKNRSKTVALATTYRLPLQILQLTLDSIPLFMVGQRLFHLGDVGEDVCQLSV